MTPIRPLTLCLAVALLLAGCVDSGTGGQPAQSLPYAQAGVAVAETAAVATQAAYAMSYASTANAVNAASTAAAAKVTAVALATATEQAQLDSAAAIGMMTREAIEAHTLQAEATATAVHLQWLVDYDARKAVNQERTAEFWHWFRVVCLVLFAAAGWIGGIRYIVPAVYARLMPDDTAVYDSDGEPIAVGKGYNRVERKVAPQVISEQYAPPSGEEYKTEVRSDKANFDVLHPSPNGFKLWLMQVLDDDTRTVFSQNEYERRGWTVAQYGHLILEMRRVGWLHSRPDGRGCYVMTDIGKQQAREWLGI